jgi:hypothetical protein
MNCYVQSDFSARQFYCSTKSVYSRDELKGIADRLSQTILTAARESHRGNPTDSDS